MTRETIPPWLLAVHRWRRPNAGRRPYAMPLDEPETKAETNRRLALMRKELADVSRLRRAIEPKYTGLVSHETMLVGAIARAENRHCGRDDD